MRRHITYGIFLMLLFSSCTERVDWDLEYQEMDLLVVEGKLTNEAGPHQVKLSRPLYEMNGTPEPVSGAEVEIYDGSSLYLLQEDPDMPGSYLSSPGLKGETKKGYQLRIRNGERRIRGVSFMPEVQDFPDMRLVRVQSDPLLYEVQIPDQLGPAIIRMELDWSHVRGYEGLPPEETHAVIHHYTLQSVDVNRIFAPDREHVRFPPGTIVFREKESISREYEEFLRGMLSETDWRGGVFDVQAGNARSNLSGGAIGYFTAGAIIRDTIVVE